MLTLMWTGVSSIPHATLNNGTDARWFGFTVQGSIPAAGFVFTPCFSHGTGEQTDKRHQHTVLRPLETTVRCHFNNNTLDITTHYVLSSLQDLLVQGCCQLDQYGELLFTALTLWLPWQRLLYISYGMGFMSCLCSCIPIRESIWLMWITGRGTFECYPPISRHTVRMWLYDTTASAPSLYLPSPCLLIFL